MKFFGILSAAVGLASAQDWLPGTYGAPAYGRGPYGGYGAGCPAPVVHYDHHAPGPVPPFGRNFLQDFYDLGPRCGVRSRTYTTGYVPKLRNRTYNQDVDFEQTPCGSPLKFLAAPEATVPAALDYYAKDFFTRGGMSAQLSETPVKARPVVTIQAPPACTC